MSLLVMFFTVAAGIGFHQAFGWNLIQIIFAMGVMVPASTFIAAHLVRPHTLKKFETDERYSWGFVVIVSVAAFAVFSSRASSFWAAEHEVARYGAIWWSVFPFVSGALVLLDRALDPFADRIA